jgi:hypothetical protein
VPYRIVDPASLAAGPGPHPAASPFDKRVSESLGVTAFEVYQVELPPKQETVRHSHVDDGVEDLYIFLSGTGWEIVDEDEVPVGSREVRCNLDRVSPAGARRDDGLVFVALCAPAP